ncbi:MAG: methyltransferase domain-containing protein, partial [Dehalococcoidia bacterium]
IAGPGPVDVVGWPEALPFRDGSFDAVTCLYFIRRFDDDVMHNFGAELRRVVAPGGAALVLDIAPVRSAWLNGLHSRLVGAGMVGADLRGWRRLAASLTDVGFDAIDLVNVGPFLLPPIPRISVLARVAPGA